MATEQEILETATKLGEMIAATPAAQKMAEVMAELEKDIDAQRLVNDLNRHAQTLQEKQAKGEPIEVEDKQKMDELQQGIARSKVLRDMQMAQMDYVDLMRKVDEAISGGPAPAGGDAPAEPAPSPIIGA